MLQNSKNELERSRSEPPPGTADLLQGDDSFTISLKFEAYDPVKSFSAVTYSATINPSWNEIFAAVAPAMINEAEDAYLRRLFYTRLSQIAADEFKDNENIKGKGLRYFEFHDHDLETCIVQFRALGLIRESQRKRSIKDTAAYWTLTPYGDRLMVQLRALRRSPSEHTRTAGTAKQVTD